VVQQWKIERRCSFSFWRGSSVSAPLLVQLLAGFAFRAPLNASGVLVCINNSEMLDALHFVSCLTRARYQSLMQTVPVFI